MNKKKKKKGENPTLNAINQSFPVGITCRIKRQIIYNYELHVPVD